MPPVDHPPEEEAEMLLVAAERRQRAARRKLRRYLSVAGIVTLAVATATLGVINVNLVRRNVTADVAPAIPARVVMAPKPEVVPVAEPEPPVFHAPPQRQRDAESSQAPADSTGRVAHWMAETYGKRDAERRAELAMTLYPEHDARTEHWRKVLDHLRETN